MNASNAAAVPVGAAAVRRVGELPARIFDAAGERWGWEFVAPGPIAVVPGRPEPVGVLPVPGWSRAVVRLRRWIGALRAWLVVAILGLVVAYPMTALNTLFEQLGVLHAEGNVQWPALHRLLVAVPIGDNLGFYLGLGNDRVAQALVLCVVARIGLGRVIGWWAGMRQQAWMAAGRESLDDYARQFHEWSAHRHQAYVRELERLSRLPQWYPLCATPEGRLDVYGGTGRGWSCLLVTAGTAVLGGGGRLTVLDLSREQVTRPLCGLTDRHGKHVRTVRFPADSARVNLLGGLDTAEVVQCLTEAVHATEAASPETHSLDVRILSDICDVLAPRLTITRIRAALRVLLRAEPPPRTGAVLTLEEFERLNDLLGQTRRTTAEGRAAILEARLHHFLDHLLSPGDGEGAALLDDAAELCVVEVGEEGGDATAGLLASLLLQVLAAGIQHTPNAAGNMLVVAGADLLPGAQLERLDRIARHHAVRLVYLFRHVREDAEELLGSGGPVLLMRVGNAKQASAAADYIGKEHRFLLHQLTMSAGTGANDSTSRTETKGTQKSTTSQGLLHIPMSWTSGTSESVSTGTSTGTSTSFNETAGRQRSYDLSVEPRELQTLPETAFFLIDPDARRGPRARLGDCNPWLVTAPGVFNGDAGPELVG